MYRLSRKLVLLFIAIILQSSLGTKAVQLNAQNLVQNGYRKYQDGFIMQWGYKTGTSTGSHTVYLNTSFSNAPYIVICTPIPKSNTMGAAVSVFIDNMYSSYFNASVTYSRGGNNGAAAESFYWLAIGK